jgi:4-hydroxybenzoate polyprenyltransferase
MVKASGPIAAVFVVNANPSPQFLLLLFGWLFFWEIGGQNVPADWNDTAEDRRVHAKTIPIQFGVEKAGLIVLITLSLTVILSCFLPLISPLSLGLPYIAATLLIGYVFLLQPGFQLYKFKEGKYAGRLFDRASYYPMAQFLVISVFLILPQFIG